MLYPIELNIRFMLPQNNVQERQGVTYGESNLRYSGKIFIRFNGMFLFGFATIRSL